MKKEQDFMNEEIKSNKTNINPDDFLNMDLANEIIEEAKFANAFRIKWIECGGLISQKIAADILNKSAPWINQLTRSGELTKITIGESVFLSFAEVSAMQQATIKNKLIKAIQERNGLPEKLKEEIIQTIKEKAY